MTLRTTRWAALLLGVAAAWADRPGEPPLYADPPQCHAQGGDLQQGFCQPPDAAKPWVYWWWLKGNVTETSITRDLEAMKQIGVGGLLLFDARGYHEDHVPPPESRMEFMSPQWRRMVKRTIEEASRLGLQVSINLSSCAGALKGPWNVGSDAPKRLLWTGGEVCGPCRIEVRLRRPERSPFWEVALLAARHGETARATSLPAQTLSQNSLRLLAGEGRGATVGTSETGPKLAGSLSVELSDNWREMTLPPPSAPTVVDVVQLADKVDVQGTLTWDVPQGRWTVIRFACTVMEGREFDVDILDPQAVKRHFERMGRPLIQDAGPALGKTLTHFYSVSWEGAAPSWTLGFEKFFAKRRGYRPEVYLPVLAGLTVTSREVSDRFLRDYHRTLADCFMDHFYGRLRALCAEAGLKWHSESGGPWNRALLTFQHADQLAFLGRNDMPQGEFWHRGRALNRPPAMAAHIYGSPLAATEAFTHMRKHWSAYPAALKPDADAAFCDGVNHFIWHTFTASPEEFGKPGIEYFAGTHLNPNVTWFDQAGPLLGYLARCQFMLRQGRFVADVCCYAGDSPYLHWGRGENWTDKPTIRLPKGYTYDLVNTEVLLDRLSVGDGDLVLPDGMRYRLLVVDLADETVPPEALRKIVALAQAGATIVLGERRPKRAPGLAGYPACDQEVRRLVAELWGEDARTSARRPLGRGKVIRATSLEDVLRAEGILPDVEAPWNYTHRRLGDCDIYFLAGAGTAECTFRVRAKEPELWDPKTGSVRDAVCYRETADGRTVVPISLPENGSVFVVFRTPARQPHLVSISGPEGGLEITGRSEAGASLRLWRDGRYGLQTSSHAQLCVDAAGIPEPLALARPWTVHFEPGRGAPASAIFNELIPWDTHPDIGIKFFSGTATYRTAFQLDADQAAASIRLHLGQVRHIAQVRVNGKPLGIVWSEPWTLDLTGQVKPGENQLEIDVTNLWVNRLIGDAALAPTQRITKTNVALRADGHGLKPYQGFAATDPLEPSGLLGPVRLEFGQLREARLESGTR